MTGWMSWVMADMNQDDLEADRVLARQIRTDRPDFATVSDADLLARALELKPLCRRLFNQHIDQSGAAGIGRGVIGAVCAAVGQPESAMKLRASEDPEVQSFVERFDDFLGEFGSRGANEWDLYPQPGNETRSRPGAYQGYALVGRGWEPCYREHQPGRRTRTSRIADGSLVEVNGDTGAVTMLELP